MWTVSAFNLLDVHGFREEACVQPGQAAETVQSRCPSHDTAASFYVRNETVCLQVGERRNS